jgi:hypothetical protein
MALVKLPFLSCDGHIMKNSRLVFVLYILESGRSSTFSHSHLPPFIATRELVMEYDRL